MSKYVLLFALVAAAASAGEREAVVAVLVAPGENPGKAADLAAILDVLLTEEPGLVPVERGKLDALMGEQKLRLAGLADANRAARTGGLVQADYMVSVSLSGKRAAFRIVETATAKVLAEGKDEARRDVFLSARMIFEELVRSVRRTPRLSSRLTVGIGALSNETGTDRSDALGERLAGLIRGRLHGEGWAIVLERQYPTPLLAEVGLARAGMTSTSIEQLPPADIVVAGSFVEKTKQFAPGTDYPVTFRLVVASGRAKKRKCEFIADGRAGDLASVAERVVEEIAENRFMLSGPLLQSVDTPGEVARLRSASQTLIPYAGSMQLEGGGRIRSIQAISDRERADLREAIRLLENILLLDKEDIDATMCLGRCVLALHRDAAVWKIEGRDQDHARKQCLRGIDLIEQAFRRNPSEHNAWAFAWAAIAAARSLGAPECGKRMIGYMLNHRSYFNYHQLRDARSALPNPDEDALLTEYELAVLDFDNRANRVRRAMMGIRHSLRESPEKVLAFAEKEALSENPYVRFFAEYVAADVYLRKKDSRAVEHFTRALEIRDEAMAAALRCKDRGFLSYIDATYRDAYGACILFKMQDRAKTILEGGMRAFLEGGPWDRRPGYCAPLLADIYAREGDVEKGMRLCDEVVRRYPLDRQLHGRARLIELRERFRALSAGGALPDFGRLHRIGGQKGKYSFPRLAKAGGKIWVVLSRWYGGGRAFYYAAGESALTPLEQVGEKAFCVAAAGERICFGTVREGLYVLDPSGRLIAHLSKERGEIPSDHIIAMASTHLRRRSFIYVGFRESDRFGVARFDPPSLKTTVLAPSSRDVSFYDEPVREFYSLWWSPDESVLWTGHQSERRTDCITTSQVMFRFDGYGWTDIGRATDPRWIAVCGGETLHVLAKEHPTQPGLRTVTMRLHPNRTPFQSDDPLLLTAHDAAWDATRLWLPTVAGLYEVDRASGAMRCVAHKDDTPIYTILKDGGWRYLGARDGIYSYRIP